VGCTAVAAVTYAIFAYLCGHAVFADHLQVPYLPGSSEVVVIASAMTGACLGFLWHNCYPASMFMGDTGSLALGGAIGLIAVLVRQELVLAIVGGIFVIEAGSVILQVSYYKLTRRLYGEPRRIFLCAPFHHHLRMKGWTETQIVIRFWVVAVVLAGVGLATLKIR
jgi:phospho-N-acetylmuramoyl-pentapeptide-transferase